MTRTRCAQGELEGADVGGVTAFLGVPYASSAGRFEPAGAPKSWEGVRDATEVAAVFPQRGEDFTLPGENGPVSMREREDAFLANVWTPSVEGSLPVLMWIHGGGWTKGSASDPAYAGGELAGEAGIVVVSVNYRLGALANLDLPGVSAGNLSVGDVLAALRWTHDTISSFGGDPTNITLAGQSAGAWHAAVLAGMPEAAPLFSKLLIMSAPDSAMLKGRDTRRAARLLLEKLGIEKSPERVRDVDAGRLVRAQRAVEQEMGGLGMQFAPFDTDGFALDGVYARAARGLGERPLLDGVTEKEATFFLADRLSGAPMPLYDLAEHVATKVAFTRENDRLAASCARAWGYRIESGSANPRVGACHCADLPLLLGNFGAWEQDALWAGTDMESLASARDAFRGAVAAFMRTGEPSCASRPDWPAFSGRASRVVF